MITHTHLTIAADHPAFAGHFPGTPIVPGVVLLDETLHAIGLAMQACQISSVKFLSPLGPGESVVIQHETLANGSIRFDIMAGTRRIATGSIAPDTAT